VLVLLEMTNITTTEATARTKKINLRQVSHALSWALRHAAPELGLSMTPDAYVPVHELIEHKHPKLKHLSLENIQQTVETSDKQRFKLAYKSANDFAVFAKQLQLLLAANKNNNDTNVLCIRANQGHSIAGLIDDASLLEPLTGQQLAAIPTIVHGTYEAAWNQIQQQGVIKRMKRNHIHLATGLPGSSGVISGMRQSCDVYIYVDAAKCAKDGIRFYKSENGVLLTSGIEGVLPVQYISHVTTKEGAIVMDNRVNACRQSTH
jgi:2'-phosphotransferase